MVAAKAQPIFRQYFRTIPSLALLGEFRVQVAALVHPDVILIPVVRTWAFVRAGLHYPFGTGEPYGFSWGRSAGCQEKSKAAGD